MSLPGNLTKKLVEYSARRILATEAPYVTSSTSVAVLFDPEGKFFQDTRFEKLSIDRCIGNVPLKENAKMFRKVLCK